MGDPPKHPWFSTRELYRRLYLPPPSVYFCPWIPCILAATRPVESLTLLGYHGVWSTALPVALAQLLSPLPQTQSLSSIHNCCPRPLQMPWASKNFSTEILQISHDTLSLWWLHFSNIRSVKTQTSLPQAASIITEECFLEAMWYNRFCSILELLVPFRHLLDVHPHPHICVPILMFYLTGPITPTPIRNMSFASSAPINPSKWKPS